MSGYQAFAAFYDRLTRDVNYPKRAEYILSVFKRHHSKGKLKVLLDLACGTGSIAVELAARGFEIIGVDSSVEMLSIASAKASDAGLPLMLVCQDMRGLDLYGTVDGAVCLLDSLNHLCSTRELAEVFKRLFLFVKPGGLLVFDVNTKHKHHNVLGDNSFVFEEEDFVCIWRNRLNKRTCEVDMQLDFFVKTGDCYIRLTDRLCERAYSLDTIRRLLSVAGFETLVVYDDLSFDPVRDDSERAVFVARRIIEKR
ncbi:MAG TPA: class I SAM-dependent methyltransferase [Candidatus Avimonas sp.]|jgi:SAM-dependent methyltransferase|nr:class I SAM-dependent methyltransferase [Clostridiales bacterium]HOB36741.1 class I SAM-dependent methyltransferase [Candidatus Avimonas sp.]HQA16218.1 class I SAM-dependent methyltransferase [Candidatus Avimonas sp.]HQD38264.1 class I SAM-dependent methyltransferase [Candidatus Avimonas sp.]